MGETPLCLCVFGTRPEAIKMAPVVRRLQASGDLRTSVVTSGQHREMLDQVLDFFQIEPEVRLDVMSENQSLSALVAALLVNLQPVIEQLKPAVVLVHGDTATTFAAALAAYYAKVPVAHVEAGLRTNNLYSPWPEESNRRLAAVITKFHFAPTEHARQALLAEGHNGDNIWVTGNTVIDALRDAVKLLEENPFLKSRIEASLPPRDMRRRRILVTGHRRENFADGLASVCSALNNLVSRGDVEVLFPIHLNPTVQKIVRHEILDNDAVFLLPPLDYPSFVTAMQSADLIMTDSGGVQEEAPSLGKPVLVLRDTTERPEAVLAGTVKLVGTDKDRILQEATRLLDDPQEYARMSMTHNPYGDGRAAERIVSVLKLQSFG